MFDFLGAMICRFKGHRWSKARTRANPYAELSDGGNVKLMMRVKTCLRCGAEREVKTRAKKAS